MLTKLKIKTKLLYPAIDFSKFDKFKENSPFDKPYFLSLNRFSP